MQDMLFLHPSNIKCKLWSPELHQQHNHNFLMIVIMHLVKVVVSMLYLVRIHRLSQSPIYNREKQIYLHRMDHPTWLFDIYNQQNKSHFLQNIYPAPTFQSLG